MRDVDDVLQTLQHSAEAEELRAALKHLAILFDNGILLIYVL